jgi:flagellar export protein FliJ
LLHSPNLFRARETIVDLEKLGCAHRLCGMNVQMEEVRRRLRALEAVIHVRERAHQDSAVALAEAIRQRDEAQAELEAVEQSTLAAQASLRAATSLLDMCLNDGYLQALDVKHIAAETSVGVADQRLETRRGIHTKAHQSLRTVERLRDTLTDRLRADEQRTEQSRVDDLITARYVREQALGFA